MPRINEEGYIERRKGGKSTGRKPYLSKWRDWYLIKWSSNKSGLYSYVSLGMLILPKRYAGKKVRFRMEVIEDKG